MRTTPSTLPELRAAFVAITRGCSRRSPSRQAPVDLDRPELDRRRPPPDGACALVFAEKSAELWSTRTRASYATLDPHELEMQHAVFARDSRVVFTEVLEVVRAIRVADGVCLASRKLESYVSALRPGKEGALLIHDGKRWLLWEYMDDRLRPRWRRSPSIRAELISRAARASTTPRRGRSSLVCRPCSSRRGCELRHA
ncbi:MAG: hypothetical protein U0270_16520 [Labilithrix sp.]